VPLVAQRLGRSYLGVDCVAEYCQMARRRVDSGPVVNHSAKSRV
jgi:DNA modification methylase